jgi:hypothetical protein
VHKTRTDEIISKLKQKKIKFYHRKCLSSTALLCFILQSLFMRREATHQTPHDPSPKRVFIISTIFPAKFYGLIPSSTLFPLQNISPHPEVGNSATHTHTHTHTHTVCPTPSAKSQLASTISRNEIVCGSCFRNYRF